VDEATTNHRFASLGLAPVSPDHPCGASARYEPEFEQLEAELAKQESLTPTAVDWKRVVELSALILQTKSKDLLVAAYLCRGLIEAERYQGLAVGLAVIRDLLLQHWEGLFPEVKRLRARGTAVAWLAEKAGRFVRDAAPRPADKAALVNAVALLKEIDACLDDKMGQDAPSLRDLSRPLKDHLQSLEAAEQQKVAQAAAPIPAAAAAASSAPAVPRPASAPAVELAEITSDGDAKKALRQLQDIARKVTKYWLGKDVADARAYRLGRLVTWVLVDSLPAQADGQTQIPAPAPERIKAFENQRQNGQVEALLPDLETALTKAPYWLDGQKFVADVLQSLGQKGEAARKTVLRELRHFLGNFSGLPELKFANGTPFADDATQGWLEAEVLTADSGGGASTSRRSHGDAPWEAALNEARATATGGNLDAAVKQLSQGWSTTGSTREQFMWRFALAQLLMQTGHAHVAASLLEELAERAEEFRLRDWEPELAARVYKLQLSAYEKSAGKSKNAQDSAAKIASTFSRLSSVDPALALSVKI
jgi:type VI secretion system protein VasJ